jgi:hypothetical protein
MQFLLITEPAHSTTVMVHVESGESADEALARYRKSMLCAIVSEWPSRKQTLALWFNAETSERGPEPTRPAKPAISARLVSLDASEF